MVVQLTLNIRKLLVSIVEALVIYGLIIVGYEILAIHPAKLGLETGLLIVVFLGWL